MPVANCGAQSMRKEAMRPNSRGAGGYSGTTGLTESAMDAAKAGTIASGTAPVTIKEPIRTAGLVIAEETSQQ